MACAINTLQWSMMCIFKWRHNYKWEYHHNWWLYKHITYPFIYGWETFQIFNFVWATLKSKIMIFNLPVACAINTLQSWMMSICMWCHNYKWEYHHDWWLYKLITYTDEKWLKFANSSHQPSIAKLWFLTYKWFVP